MSSATSNVKPTTQSFNTPKAATSWMNCFAIEEYLELVAHLRGVRQG
jgi:hypothetical protein